MRCFLRIFNINLRATNYILHLTPFMPLEKRRKLLLINPSYKARKGFLNDNLMRFMPIALGVVAALTPDTWDVEFLDENYEDFHYIEADLVGFTAFTSSALRAYEIAKIYREKGIKTVMGGIHATMCTEEVMQYVDIVVTHDAESVWSTVLSDFEAGTLKKVYAGGFVDAHQIPKARREIYNKYPYYYELLQTARGCPMSCDFCSVSQMCGTKYRERDVEEVLDELQETKGQFIFFVDDNLIGVNKKSQERAIRLFKGMVERGIKKHWVTQASINVADNDEVLYWAKKSGCKLFLIGIEAETPKALKEMNKSMNLKRGAESYEHAIAKLHKHGIVILATIIFAMESDTIEDMYARRDFILNSSIDCYQTTILTPLPGTVVFDRLKDRIVKKNFPADWPNYQWSVPLLDMPNMSADQIGIEMRNIWLSIYNKESIRRKMLRTLWNTKSLVAAYYAYSTNHTYGRMMLEMYIKDDPDAVDYNMEWKSKPRSAYLKMTDKLLRIFYLLKWNRPTL